MGFWDDETLAPNGDWFKFVNAGDTINGKIDKLVKRTFTRDDGTDNTVVEIVFEDGRRVTASQAMLARRLYEERPEPGDWLEVTFTGEQRLSPTRSMKVFEVVKKPKGEEPKRNGGARKATTAAKKPQVEEDDEVPF